MKLTSFLMVIAVLAVVISAVNLFSNLALFSTGYASSDQGNVTLEIESKIDVNFTQRALNWSLGYVDPAQPYAYLTSTGILQNNISWLNVSNGLVIESLSTQNITLNLSSNKDALNFLDNGQVVSPSPSNFSWRVNQVTTDDTGPGVLAQGEPGTCSGLGQALNPTVYETIVQGVNRTVCGNMSYLTTSNSIEIDFALNISVGAPPGPKNVTITATAQKAN
jgi:hypothetical protein